MKVKASAPTTAVIAPNEHDNSTANAMMTPTSSQTAKAASNRRHMISLPGIVK